MHGYVTRQVYQIEDPIDLKWHYKRVISSLFSSFLSFLMLLMCSPMRTCSCLSFPYIELITWTLQHLNYPGGWAVYEVPNLKFNRAVHQWAQQIHQHIWQLPLVSKPFKGGGVNQIASYWLFSSYILSGPEYLEDYWLFAPLIVDVNLQYLPKLGTLLEFTVLLSVLSITCHAFTNFSMLLVEAFFQDFMGIARVSEPLKHLVAFIPEIFILGTVPAYSQELTTGIPLRDSGWWLDACKSVFSSVRFLYVCNDFALQNWYLQIQKRNDILDQQCRLTLYFSH